VLRQVSEAEVVLRELGFGWVRVRHHGPLARIEVPASDLPRLVTVAGEVAARLKKLGYNYITADLEGYRTGSLNETLKTEE
jgi:uncharacterized protein